MSTGQVSGADQKPPKVNVTHLALAGGGGAGLLFAVLELLHGDPKEWTSLLEHWGPWFLFAMFVSWLGYDLVKTIGLKLLAQVVNLVANVGEMANALQAMSTKDDADARESQLMSSFAARTAEKTAAAVAEQGKKLDQILSAVQRGGAAG